jgi:hypothetical protein
MKGMHPLSGTKHKREPESHPVTSSTQISDSKNEKPMTDTEQLILDQYTCPLTHELFFDPIRAEPSQQYYERSQFLEWIKDEKHTDPMTRQRITGYTEPDLMFQSLMSRLFSKHAKMNEQRYFNLSLLLSALKNNETKVIEKFISLFEISPERLETLGDQKGIAHFTAISLFSSYKIAALKRFIKNISQEELNRIIPEGSDKGISAVYFLAGNPEGCELLKDKNLRDKLSAEALNAIIFEGPNKGSSAAYYLAGTPEGLELLKDKNLRDKISTEALNAIIPEGPDKGKSAAFYLAGTHEGRELLKDKNLRDKISAETLNTIIPEGPDTGKSAANLLAANPKGRELLKDKNLRDKISAEALNAIIPDGPSKGMCAAACLINDKAGIEILLLDHGRLLKMISSNVLHQCRMEQTNESIASWLQNSEKGKSILKDYPALWHKVNHPPQRGALGLFDAVPVAPLPQGNDFKTAASHKKI